MSWADEVVAAYEARREAAAAMRRERSRKAGRANAARMTAEDKARFAALASQGGKARAKQLTPEYWRRLAVLGGKASQAKKTPEERKAFGRRGAAAASAVLTPELRREYGRRAMKSRYGKVSVAR